MEIFVRIHQQGSGEWFAEVVGSPEVTARGPSPEACIAALRAALAAGGSSAGEEGQQPIFAVETVPVLAGVAEAAEVMGWDKRRVITYIDRGRFPQPIQALASGRVWRRSDVEQFAAEWHARQARRKGSGRQGDHAQGPIQGG
jgi:predicted RNase H-like HicB family nuclease/predicted DNA-binding transcriptional regulator AlpA